MGELDVNTNVNVEIDNKSIVNLVIAILIAFLLMVLIKKYVG